MEESPTTALGRGLARGDGLVYGAPPRRGMSQGIKMSYFIYIIKSIRTSRYYTGSSANVERRLQEHNRKKTQSTKNGIPWEIVITEKYDTRIEACKRERQIKSYKGGNAFKKLINIL